MNDDVNACHPGGHPRAPGGPAALVTGGASGIGKATVERFLADGWAVVAADYNPASGEALLASAEKEGVAGRLRFVRADVAVEDDVAAAVAATVDAFGRIDAVVNNAGVGGAFGPITELEVEDWDYTFAVNTRGVFLGIKHGARAMQALETPGSIVNTASVAGLSAGAGPQAYSAAKAAVISLTRSAAVELAPKRIRVNGVAPGLIITPILGPFSDRASALAGEEQPWLEPGRPEDVASLICYLAGQESGFITGETVTIDGGLTAAGPRLGDRLVGAPVARGLIGVAKGTTGERTVLRRRLDRP